MKSGVARPAGDQRSGRDVMAIAAATAVAFAVVAIGAGPPLGPLVVGPFFLVVPATAAARFVPPARPLIRLGVAIALGLAGVVLVAETLLLAGLFSGDAVVAVVGVLAVAAVLAP
jgi:hypothetical protein